MTHARRILVLLYQIGRYALAALGAWLLAALYIERWGLATVIWCLVFPAVTGLVDGMLTIRASRRRPD